MNWKASAESIREELKSAIPEKWTLDKAKYDKLQDVTSVPSSCGLLTTKQLAITDKTASVLAEDIQKGQLTAVEVTEAFCRRAAISHQLVNCLTAFFPEKALARARELDDHFTRTGQTVGPLHGVPIAVKDTYDVLGYATTWGYAAKANHRADRESATIKTLREAGAVIFAKTTMPQGGMMLETVSNLYGRTLNPFNSKFVAGGSSGGDGALVAMKGSPFCPSTDIGGSIRAPAAFNGLYGIRPTADRVPKRGMMSVESGQLNIRVSCGPVGHSVDDLNLMSKVLLSSPERRYDTTCIPMPWQDVASLEGKLAFGMWDFDGVVMPHPPIMRALRETATRLEKQGHEIVKFEMPFDCWQASQDYFDIYYQCGSQPCTDLLSSAGEEPWGPVQRMYKIYNIKDGQIDARQLVKLIQTQNNYRNALSDAWDATKKQTSTGRPIDGLLCPASPLAGYPHEFLPYWGYTSLFNLVDYPSTILPVKSIKINEVDDPKDKAYVPRDNAFDRDNYEIYDPELWSSQPVAIQLVGRPFDDERLMAVTEVVDKSTNGDPVVKTNGYH